MQTTKIFAIACLLVASAAFAQPIPTPEAGEADDNVRAVHAQFEAAWNRHDTAALAGMWTENGDYTEPDGRTVFGPKEVKRLFDIEHASVFKDSELHLVVERVRTPSADVAIVDGTYELFNARDPAGNEIGTRTGYFTNVVVNDGGTWKVSAARLMLPVTLIWRAQ
jgi:uncharacterized protein (TIGR02246 family)